MTLSVVLATVGSQGAITKAIAKCCCRSGVG